MFKQNSILLFYLLLLLLTSCNETIIEIPRAPCTTETQIPYSLYKLIIDTDTSSVCIVRIYNKNIISGDNILISNNGHVKNAKINGYFCGDSVSYIKNFHIDVVYNDSADNSGLKIEGSLVFDWITGKILYCSDFQNCSYAKIGTIDGWKSDYAGSGTFVSPLFNGTFYCRPARPGEFK